jgi:signal transduction histidine kinase
MSELKPGSETPREPFTDGETMFAELTARLLGNALEHSGADVTVRVGTLDSECGFSLDDDGTGIPAAEQSCVFESGYSTSANGTGLGLPIIREIADAHGWSTEITDSSEGGARFEFRFVDPGP